MQEPVRFRTTGFIAEELRIPLHRLLYILRTRKHIRPAALAGRVRLYDRAALAMIRHELNAQDARREASDQADGGDSEWLLL